MLYSVTFSAKSHVVPLPEVAQSVDGCLPKPGLGEQFSLEICAHPPRASTLEHV